MLSSAFSKDSDSVFVDLLTLADLEMLKARKTGASVRSDQPSQSQSQSMTASRRQLKRYLILTYTGEFDRVHFPLPLAFEEKPNAVALVRTIRRLRLRLKEKDEQREEPASEKER
jgi:coiled-coil domain-containing protein 61